MSIKTKVNMDDDLIEKNVRKAKRLDMDEFLEIVACCMREYYSKEDYEGVTSNIKDKNDITSKYIRDMLEEKNSQDYPDIDYLEYLNDYITNELGADITVEYDAENWDWELVTIKGGLPGIILYRGGDWECSIAIFIYSDDGERLRAYIPKYGNPFNIDTMTAFGNDNEADEQYLVRTTGDTYVDVDPYNIATFDDDAVAEAVKKGIREAISVTC